MTDYSEVSSEPLKIEKNVHHVREKIFSGALTGEKECYYLYVESSETFIFIILKEELPFTHGVDKTWRVSPIGVDMNKCEISEELQQGFQNKKSFMLAFQGKWEDNASQSTNSSLLDLIEKKVDSLQFPLFTLKYAQSEWKEGPTNWKGFKIIDKSGLTVWAHDPSPQDAAKNAEIEVQERIGKIGEDQKTIVKEIKKKSTEVDENKFDKNFFEALKNGLNEIEKNEKDQEAIKGLKNWLKRVGKNKFDQDTKTIEALKNGLNEIQKKKKLDPKTIKSLKDWLEETKNKKLDQETLKTLKKWLNEAKNNQLDQKTELLKNWLNKGKNNKLDQETIQELSNSLNKAEKNKLDQETKALQLWLNEIQKTKLDQEHINSLKNWFSEEKDELDQETFKTLGGLLGEIGGNKLDLETRKALENWLDKVEKNKFDQGTMKALGDELNDLEKNKFDQETIKRLGDWLDGVEKDTLYQEEMTLTMNTTEKLKPDDNALKTLKKIAKLKESAEKIENIVKLRKSLETLEKTLNTALQEALVEIKKQESLENYEKILGQIAEVKEYVEALEKIAKLKDSLEKLEQTVNTTCDKPRDLTFERILKQIAELKQSIEKLEKVVKLKESLEKHLDYWEHVKKYMADLKSGNQEDEVLTYKNLQPFVLGTIDGMKTEIKRYVNPNSAQYVTIQIEKKTPISAKEKKYLLVQNLDEEVSYLTSMFADEIKEAIKKSELNLDFEKARILLGEACNAKKMNHENFSDYDKLDEIVKALASSHNALGNGSNLETQIDEYIECYEDLRKQLTTGVSTIDYEKWVKLEEYNEIDTNLKDNLIKNEVTLVKRFSGSSYTLLGRFENEEERMGHLNDAHIPIKIYSSLSA